MSSSKCARCDQTVYPVEGLRCLDKIWHKGCFKCQECNMTLNLKNYKGFDKKPYCNAHCPQAKATTVADTPEIRRLAENTRIQSQAKYHEDFEKSKGKGFTAIADDPETLRIKETSKIISNVAYHGELERKKQMEEKRHVQGPEDVSVPVSNNNVSSNNNNNNNMIKMNGKPGQMRAPLGKVPSMTQNVDYSPKHSSPSQGFMIQQNLPHIHSQLQQQQLHQQQQMMIKQQQQQLYSAQDQNRQILLNRHSIDGSMQQRPNAKMIHAQQPQHYPTNQQQMMARQQHQILMQPQQNRHSMDPSLPMANRQHKQPVNHNNNIINHQPMIKGSPQIMQHIQQVPGGHQISPVHLIGGQQQPPPPHIMNQLNGQRISSQNQPNLIMGPRGMHPHFHMALHDGYKQQGPHLQGPINEIMPKQQQQQQVVSQRLLIHPQQNKHHQQQMRPMNQQQVIHQPQPMPRRIFRAIYDYVANDVDEVSFYENDILIDCVNVDGNWLIGKVARSGQTGMLPANYVAEVVPTQ